jgi:hypothetical protein
MKRIAINAFLAFHLLSLSCWCVPMANPLTMACRSFVRPYFLWVGLFQSWDTFSPSPKTVNSYVAAIVLYRDGNTKNWQFPRMEQLSLWERYHKERYRKFSENLQTDMYAALWPDAARFIARQNNTGPSAVSQVFLVRYWSNIVPRSDGSYVPSAFDAHLFYGYSVLPEDLR